MGLDKVVLEYIGTTAPDEIIKEARASRRVSRKGVQQLYDSYRTKYKAELAITESVKEEGKALQKKYDQHKELRDEYYEQMEFLRNSLKEMDDDGEDFILRSKLKKPKAVEKEDDDDEDESDDDKDSEDDDYDDYGYR